MRTLIIGVGLTLLAAGCSASSSPAGRHSGPSSPTTSAPAASVAPSTVVSTPASSAAVAGPSITSAHLACIAEVTAMVDFARNDAATGGTGGLPDLVPFLGQSPLLVIAQTTLFQLQQGGTPTAAAGSIAQSCTRRKDPVLSAPELLDVQNVAVPRDVALLQRVTVTR